MTLKKVEQRNVVLFTLVHGPCAARSIQLYCQDCSIDYHHNYTVFEGMRIYYDKQLETIQVTDHVFMEKSVVELFKTAMDVSWTSATNCARLYNMCLLRGKQTPDGYHAKFKITGDHVWDAFVITALLKDSKYHMHSLTVPQTATHKVSVIVVDGVTVGHPCCSVCNCHIPLSNNHHQFCPTHSSNDSNCSIIGCDLPVISGHRTCLTPAHQHVEKTYQLHGQLRFQLQECLTRSRVAHPNDATHNEQLMVAPCGMMIARQTFFGAEGVVTVKDFIKNIYAGPNAMKPDHIFFDNNCTLSKMVKDDPFFEEIGLLVDVFHFNCKHSQSDTYCQENCNPADYPELLGDNGKGWHFNSSIAEQTNGWFGGYHSICHEMLAHKFNFFCDELILRRN
ncbi:hypothetical protein BDR03DRAFT_934617 [Suillus americanus]|nr:hypothetical protein BDR03DRAFT_934617 [Suillus americanus]